MFQLANGTFVPEEPTPADLFALLDDEYARAILAATSEQATSAPALAEACDASHPTIYRRIDRLKDQNLLAERTEPESRWTPPPGLRGALRRPDRRSRRRGVRYRGRSGGGHRRSLHPSLEGFAVIESDVALQFLVGPEDLSTLLTAVTLVGIVLGLIVGYQAYRGYRRNDSPAMFWLALGLVLLVVVPLPLSLALSVLDSAGLVSLPALGAFLPLVRKTANVGGLLCILYALYGRD
jgi:DNA-binding transcriptional ArsR family regulator